MKKVLRAEACLFSAVVLVGFLDWLTTVVGIFFFGASEMNPVLSGLTRSSMIMFSFVKLSVVIFVGFAFYKAAGICRHATTDLRFTKKFLYGVYSFTFLALTAVVTSNMLTILRI